MLSGTMAGTVIVGAGLGGVQAAATLRSRGYDERIVLIGDESDLPYHRPPLSKHALCSEARLELLRPATFFDDHEIELVRGVTATRLDPTGRTVTTSGGERISWDQCVIATGSAPRRLPAVPSDLDGVHVLRTVADAHALWARPVTGAAIVIVGGGFIGLEFAAAARTAGAEVTVVEVAPRLLPRVVSPSTSRSIARYHRSLGIVLFTGERVIGVDRTGRAVSAIRLESGRTVAADMVLVAAGAIPRVELAAAAGLSVDAGIVVDVGLRTSAAGVFAIGDCASWSDVAGKRRRLESVQNASDQGAHVADAILGSTGAYQRSPWFWSDQAELRLQIAGVAAPGDAAVVVPGESPSELTVLLHDQGRVTCVETLGRPGDHVAGRRLVGQMVDVDALERGATTLRDQARCIRVA